MDEKDLNKYLIRISNNEKKEVEVETDLAGWTIHSLLNTPALCPRG